MGLINYMVKFFQDGGFWMWPIMIVGGIGFAIAIERQIKLHIVKKANKKMWDALQPVLAEGDFDKAREMTEQDNSSISRLLSLGLARQGAVRRREANNCTYKVRRFNYFDYGRKNWPGLLGLMLNPDVTVRGQEA